MAKTYNRIIEILIQKDIISETLFQQALDMFHTKYVNDQKATLTTQRILQILIDEFKIERHLIFNEIASLYAFKEIDLHGEEIDESRIEFIRQIFYELPEDTRNSLL